MQVPCFRSAVWDAHPGSPEIQQCCSVSQQPWTGNQQMENELHICLEDICFGPAFTGLFLIIYLSPEKEKCFVQRLEANPANTEPKPQLDDGFLKSWTWCGMMGCSGSCSDIHPVYSEVLPLTQWKKTKLTFFLYFFFSPFLPMTYIFCLASLTLAAA